MSTSHPRRTGMFGTNSGGWGGGGGGGASGIGPNVTPMVDVVLVILIFFMASASIAGHEWFLDALVTPEQREQAERDATASNAETSITASPSVRLPDVVVPVHLSVDERGNTWATAFGGTPTNLAGVRSTISDLIADAPADEVIVRLSAEPNTPYDAVVRVREMCAQLGITRVAIVAGR